MMISLDLAKSSEVRKAGDQSNYKITFQVLVKKAFRQSGHWIWLFLHVLQRNFEEKLCFSGFGYPMRFVTTLKYFLIKIGEYTIITKKK